MTAGVEYSFTRNLNEPDATRAPFWIVKNILSSNVTRLSVCGGMTLAPAAPHSGSALVIAVMGRSLRPNALEIRKRISQAPMDLCSLANRGVEKNYFCLVLS